MPTALLSIKMRRTSQRVIAGLDPAIPRLRKKLSFEE
jgi:hypothetical protein